MTKQWPTGFFVYTDDTKEETPQAESAVEVVEEVAEAEPVEEPKEIAVEEVQEDTPVPEDFCDGLDFDLDEADEDDEDLPDLEEELEIALEEAHKSEVAKQHRIAKGVTAGIAILGAVGLATGLSIHAYFKRKV